MGGLMNKADENNSCIDGTCTRMIYILACRASEKFIA